MKKFKNTLEMVNKYNKHQNEILETNINELKTLESKINHINNLKKKEGEVQ